MGERMQNDWTCKVQANQNKRPTKSIQEGVFLDFDTAILKIYGQQWNYLLMKVETV